MEYEKVILASLCTSHGELREETKRNVEYALTNLSPEFFTAEGKALYGVFTGYFQETGGGLVDRDVFLAVIRDYKLTPELTEKYVTLFEEVYKTNYRRDKFILACRGIKRSYRDVKYVQAMEKAASVFKNGGQEAYEKSRTELDAGLNRIDLSVGLDNPEGVLSEEMDPFMAEHFRRRREPVAGLLTGFDQIDAVTHGHQLGELWFVCGYTGQGKSTWMHNYGHNAYVEGANVVYFTGETLKTQLVRRVVACHSNMPKFDIPGGLSYERMKVPDPNDKEFTSRLESVTKDIKDNSKYGRFVVCQFPYKANMEFIRRRLAAYQSLFNVDLVFIDEIRLLSATSRHPSEREVLNEIVLDCKSLAVTHNNGAGTRICAAHQVNRTSHEKAVLQGHYDIDACAGSDEFEKSADLLTWVLRTEQNERENELTGGIVKYRDGRPNKQFPYFTNMDSCYFSSIKA